MMKRKTKWARLALALLSCLCLPACALAYDANTAGAWLSQFAAALESIPPINDPTATADPARAGQVLLEYEFGTVLASSSSPAAQEILEIEVRNAQVTDCRNVRVGMGVESALSGETVGASTTQLYVLGTQESGWHWAYVNQGQVYGVEYIAYGGDAEAMKEYTLTYVIESGVISAIRMRIADATQAQAQEGLATAQEIASRQNGEVLAMVSGAPVFAAEDLQVNGTVVLGRPVHELVACMGEPKDIQTLPEGKGRILVYDGAAVRLELDERTGVEVVRGVSTTGARFEGPRRLSVGLSVQEATALFCCENEVSTLGGTLYLAGESMDDPPYGKLFVSGGETMLVYACAASGETAMLEAGISGGVVTYWHLYFADDAEGGV